MKSSGKQTTQPVKLGITGGIGSGKSYVCDRLRENGMIVVSADAMAKNAVLPGTSAYQKIVDYFGAEILCSDKTLDRKKLRGIITKDKENKKMLEQFVHPEVFLQMDREYQNAVKRHAPAIAFEIPLLFETNMAPFFDYVLTVFVVPDIRLKRIMNRDRVSDQQAMSMINIQIPDAEKIKQSDFVIDNSGPFEETNRLIDQFYENFAKAVKIS